MCINGQPYVVGESGEQHGLVTQQNCASRYMRDNYSILTTAVLGSLYERDGEVKVFSVIHLAM
jgi:hypothetical protein